MSTHPDESLPAHDSNIAGADHPGDRSYTLTVGTLRQSLRDLPVDTPVMVMADPTGPPRTARYAHHGAIGKVLIIDARQARLPRQVGDEQAP
ncbi:MAG TPA: hypothetical protein VHX15_20455 [Frankiaceae bacterium]|jgi:hypothetical protein|nr:hypothetical protein [Frankiaceae bacterium]